MRARQAPHGPPAKVIFIARHGRTHMNRLSQIGGQVDSDGLDALGYKQRVGLFLLLRGEPLAAVYTSSLLRSRQSAEPIAAERGITPQATPDLNEFRGGVSEGICYSLLGKQPVSKGAQVCDEPSTDPVVQRAEAFLRAEEARRFGVGVNYRWPGGGESLLDVDKRLKRFIEGLPVSLRDKTILIVGHSGTNRFLLARLMGWSMTDGMRIRQEHTQVFRVERREGGKRPLLSVTLGGKWVACPEPATQAGGLPCLAPKPRHAP